MRETGCSEYSGVRELVRLGHAAEALGGGQQEPVVGADVQPALPVAQGERAPAAPHAGIDHGEMDAGGHVRERVREHERPLEHVPGRIPCVTSITRASGAIVAITP